jgi:spore coat polysaccharide biosynthesis protein SpsF
VGPYIEKNPDIFKIKPVYILNNMEHLRWTLDTPEDHQLINEIFNELYNEDNIFLTKDILELLERKPNLLNINDKIVRNEGYLISLNDDEKVNNE